MRAIPKLPTVAFVKTNLLPQESQHDVSYIVFALYFIHRVVIQPFFFLGVSFAKKRILQWLAPQPSHEIATEKVRTANRIISLVDIHTFLMKYGGFETI